jgi:hypothetical protein
MIKKTNFEISEIARATASAERVRSERKAMRHMQKLCSKALTSKIPAGFQATIAALRTTARKFSKA